MRYSIVIPAHNESENLVRLLKSACSALQKTNEKFEIIAVNDNSTDDSLEMLKSLKRQIKEVVIVNRTKNPGVGYAIREGLGNAKGDVIITMDGDLSHDPSEIPKFLGLLNGYDMVCGSRYIKGGKADMALGRVVISGLFNFVFRVLIGLPIRDFTSGYRAYKREVVKKIRLKSKTFGIYIEIPIKAHLAGFRLAEIPISYHKREFGKSNLNYFRQGPEYFKVIFEALRMKFFWK
ncbi:glycosyltransferase [Candidatus Woesearchaeota archaeon]|nr:glycosyltransferase [Candidatus Woesearchaeota archaeon]